MPKPIEILAASPSPALAEALRQAQAAHLDLALAPDAAPIALPCQAAYARILRERRGARGWDDQEIVRYLAQPAWRAVVRLLAGECAGLLLLAAANADDGAQARAALALLEPAPGMSLVPLRLALRPGGAVEYAVLADPAAAPGALAAAITSAAAVVANAWDQPLQPVVVDFAHDRAGTIATAGLAALRARGDACAGAVAVSLYSPFFYAHGVLQAGRLHAAIRERGPATPLIAVPRLGAAFTAALAAAGVPLTGTLLAGAERPAAWLEASASAGQIALTLHALARVAATGP